MSSEVDEHIEKLVRVKQAYRLALVDCKKRLADVKEDKRLLEIRYRTALIDLENACIVKSRQSQ